MSGSPFYVDPACEGWPKPNLISGLIAAPTTEKLSPLERQITVVLAWLTHHSRAFARSLLERFFVGDEAALAAIRRPEIVIGARAWGTLRKLEGLTGDVYPDLTIAGSGRSFELMVELKIDAELHWWDLPDGTRLYQPDAYIRAWTENYEPEGEAIVRKLGTLTKNGPGIQLEPGPYRAADLRWADVRELLGQLLEEGKVETDVLAVALDAAAAIDERILIVKEPPPINDPVISWGYAFLTALAPAIAERLPGGSLKQGAAVWTDYAGAYVYFETASGTQRLHLFATPREGRYNAPGCGSSLWICETPDHPWPPSVRTLMDSVGVPEVKDKEGWKSRRLGLDVARIQAAGDEQAQLAYVLEAAAPLVEALNSTG
jgi:hypothetical protein